METLKPICKMCNKSNISIIEFCKNANGLYYDCCRPCVNIWVRDQYKKNKRRQKRHI